MATSASAASASTIRAPRAAKGTSSDHGTSEGEFGAGEAERYDVDAGISWAADAGLPARWLLGWSFGTELALKWGNDPAVEGAILLSPALHRATDADLDRWAASGRPLVALVPELDDYLRPEQARARFARVPQAEVIAADKGGYIPFHLVEQFFNPPHLLFLAFRQFPRHVGERQMHSHQ